MAAVAERLVLGVATTTEGGSREALERPVIPADHKVPPHSKRTVLDRGNNRDLADLFVGLPVEAVVHQGAGRTTFHDQADLLRGGIVRPDPRSSITVENSR
jgi:hypothetical protein